MVLDMNELVSVLMCVYNTPQEYLEEATESILKQTYENIEFVIVDDATEYPSNVDYLRRVASEDSRIKLVRNKVNEGLTKSLNIGMSLCEGKYIARMDSDDISMPDRIGKQVAYLQLNPEVALLGSGILCYESGTKETTDFRSENKIDDQEVYRIRSMFEHSGPPHPTFMFRSDFLLDNRINYREDILKAQDYGIISDIIKSGGIIRRLEEPLLLYRVHDGQISSLSRIEQKAYQSRVSFDHIKYLFQEMPDDECLALSLLGCGFSPSELVTAVKQDKNLRKTCGCFIENCDKFDSAAFFIRSIKDIIELNKTQKRYPSDKFDAEVRRRWWKLALRTSKKKHFPWGITLYTVLGYRYV